MNHKRLLKTIIVYVLMIPVTWLLSAMVYGGAYGYIGGKRIAKAYSETELGNELCEFMKKHGATDSMTKEESKRLLENLSPQDKAEFRRILFSKVKTDDIESFGFIFTVFAIVFGLTGLLSGLLTRICISAGIFPIAALLASPIRRFIVLGYMTGIQKVITILIAQFVMCYAFAYLGSFLRNRLSKKTA